jgi:tRNA G18 (ribose-2'-O)-methylase SpoU
MYIKSNDLFKETHPERIYEKIEKPIIIADHLLTPDNMGSMIRLADNIGASEMCFLGVAPTHSLSKVKKAAASSKDNIKWYYTEDDDLRKIVGDKKIVAIETSDDAECIYDCELPSDIAFIVGNESRGIREEILQQCDKIVYIPVPGPTRSLNVSHAAAVALFEWQRQMLNFELKTKNEEL